MNKNLLFRILLGCFHSDFLVKGNRILPLVPFNRHCLECIFLSPLLQLPQQHATMVTVTGKNALLPACSLFTITTSKSLLDATDELGSGGFTTILQNQLFRYDDKDDDDDDAPNQLSVYSMFWKHKCGNGN